MGIDWVGVTTQRRNTHKGTTELMTIRGSRQTSCRFRTYECALAFLRAIVSLANWAGSAFVGKI